MKIYLVQDSDGDVLGVFSSREKANEYLQDYCYINLSNVEEFFIDERTLDPSCEDI